jgi:uncharacterized protein YkuJ
VTFLSDCLRGSSILIRLERNGEVMKIVTFLSDCLRGSSILIRLKRNGEVMKIVTFLSDCLRGSSILIRFKRNGEVMKIVTFLSDCLRGSSILNRFKRNGEVMKFVTLFYLTEIPQFWSDMGEGWGDGEVILSGCLRRFLHSDQIWGEVMKIVTFFYLTVWDSSILIRFEVRWWKSWPFFIWLFEIPPFWSSEVMKIVTCFLSDCLGFLHSDQILARYCYV